MDYITTLRQFIEDTKNEQPGPRASITLSRDSVMTLLQQMDESGSVRITQIVGEYALTADGRLFMIQGQVLHLCKPFVPEPAPTPAPQDDDWEAA